MLNSKKDKEQIRVKAGRGNGTTDKEGGLHPLVQRSQQNRLGQRIPNLLWTQRPSCTVASSPSLVTLDLVIQDGGTW